MEQHRRIHQKGSGASRSNKHEDSKVKKIPKQPTKKNALKAVPQQLQIAIEQQLAQQQQVQALHAVPQQIKTKRSDLNQFRRPSTAHCEPSPSHKHKRWQAFYRLGHR